MRHGEHDGEHICDLGNRCLGNQKAWARVQRQLLRRMCSRQAVGLYDAGMTITLCGRMYRQAYRPLSVHTARPFVVIARGRRFNFVLRWTP